MISTTLSFLSQIINTTTLGVDLPGHVPKNLSTAGFYLGFAVALYAISWAQARWVGWLTAHKLAPLVTAVYGGLLGALAGGIQKGYNWQDMLATAAFGTVTGLLVGMKPPGATT